MSVPFGVVRLLTCAAAAVLGLSPCTSWASQPPAPTPEPAAQTEPTVLQRLTAAYLNAPTTERLRVTVRKGELPPRRSLLLVRLEPDDSQRSIARAVIRAGRLLIEARPGKVRAIVDVPDSPIFEGESSKTTLAQTLDELLPPLPIASLDVSVDSAIHRLTAYAPGAVITNPDSRQRSGAAALLGTCTGGTFRLEVDAATGRIRRLDIQRDDSTTVTIEHAPSTADLAKSQMPAGRKLVPSMSQLAAGLPPSAIGTNLAVGKGSAAADVLAQAARSKSGNPRPVVVMLGSPSATSARPSGASIAATIVALAEDLATQANQLPERGAPAASPLDAGFVLLWQAADEAEDAAISRAVSAADVLVAGLNGVEGELSRVAPGSAAAFVVLAADGTIASIHPLERLSSDPEQQLAELMMALLEAVSTDTAPTQGP